MNVLGTPHLQLKVVVALIAALCAFVLGSGILRYMQEGMPGTLILAVLLFLPVAVGLWFLQAWARGLAVVLLWIHVIAVFFTTIHPMADDAPAQQSTTAAYLFLVPQVAIALYFLHILGKHKALFRWRAKPQA